MSAKVKVKWTNKLGQSSELQVKSGKDAAILDLCEDEGVNLPYGCRSGSCGSCRVQIVAGAELLTECSYLEQDTLERHHDTDDIRLACRACLKAQASQPAQALVMIPAKTVVFDD